MIRYDSHMGKDRKWGNRIHRPVNGSVELLEAHLQQTTSGQRIARGLPPLNLMVWDYEARQWK